MATGGVSVAEAARRARENVQVAHSDQPEPKAKLGECVVVIERPRCQAVNAINGQACGAMVAVRLIYVRGFEQRPVVTCRRCGTEQEYGE